MYKRLPSTDTLLSKPPYTTNIHDLKHNLVDELKNQNNFQAGEALFAHLLKRLQLQDSFGQPADVYNPDKPKYFRTERPFGFAEIGNFRKAVVTMIRYSPHPETGLKYASFLLEQIDPPLRDGHTEITALINLIYIYSHSGADEYLKNALDFVKIGLDRGLHLYRKSHYEETRTFKDSSSVFSSVCKPILRYHKLQPTLDGRGLEPYVSPGK
ncbi:hypothetical protein BDB00DRAFT_640003 [Zychaea mexicana]|uniref:uncharacterized protein n=1 Tax=Zychaea mexicana TaxID=64656 RepID=UPI0022FE9233|nr:uncharacterized protein BDB00DRAFT_640003 [Zychaea mexicana]KAI9489024.1 hypothetical protein BDB00DRAFT_640003 [Zychaea mexicana]